MIDNMPDPFGAGFDAAQRAAAPTLAARAARLAPVGSPGAASGGTSAEAPRDASPVAPAQALPLLDPRAWTQPAPARRWVVPDWVPSGVVTALYGDGGIGKTLAAQQLMTCCSIGAPWLGLDVKRGRTLGVFCEDDEDELQRRQEAINRALGANMNDLAEMRLLSRLGEDNALVRFNGMEGNLTAFHEALRITCQKWKPDLVIADTAADLYPDSEIDRSKVRWFIQMALASLAREMKCAVVLLAHPSASGLQTGEGTGGSTAWNNTVRSRLYLEREKGDDADVRILSRKKANYAARDASIRLTWQDGVLLCADASTAQDRVSWETLRRMQDEIDRRWKAGTPFSHQPNTRRGGRYFPDWAKQEFGMPPKKTISLVAGWLMNGFLADETANTSTKTKGLRLVKTLEP